MKRTRQQIAADMRRKIEAAAATLPHGQELCIGGMQMVCAYPDRSLSYLPKHFLDVMQRNGLVWQEYFWGYACRREVQP